MKLADLKLKEFLEKTAGNDPVPGGGSISALNGAIGASLAEMVADLTIGRKKYEQHEEQMKQIAEDCSRYSQAFVEDIDTDSDAYNQVFEAFKLPKETDEEKAVRSERIQQATVLAAEVPLGVARRAFEMMDSIAEVAEKGNQNAVTDACVAMMSARTAVLGAALNVRINLLSLKDKEYVGKVAAEVELLEREAIKKEQQLLERVNKELKL